MKPTALIISQRTTVWMVEIMPTTFRLDPRHCRCSLSPGRNLSASSGILTGNPEPHVAPAHQKYGVVVAQQCLQATTLCLQQGQVPAGLRQPSCCTTQGQTTACVPGTAACRGYQPLSFFSTETHVHHMGYNAQDQVRSSWVQFRTRSTLSRGLNASGLVATPVMPGCE